MIEFGYATLIWASEALGRRGSYFIFNVGALASSLYLFWYVNDLDALLWFMLVYGYFVIGGFGTFAVHLPELFPTRVRATGQGFLLECGALRHRYRAANRRLACGGVLKSLTEPI